HCYDKKKVPVPETFFTPCEGDEVCVPDKILLMNGKRLKACTFFIDNKPGGCLSTVIKLVDDNKDVMKQDVCDPDERCVPCTNPVDNSPTGACVENEGVHVEDCLEGDAAKEPGPCCHGAGQCMPRENAPKEMRDHLEQEMCKGGQVCVPAGSGTTKPKSCEVLTFSGICTDLCFAKVFQATTQVTRSSCGPTEMCMPCALAPGPVPGCN